MKEMYAVIRYFKTKKTKQVLKDNLTIDQARKMCEEYPTRKKKRTGEFSSFVGFTKMSNL